MEAIGKTAILYALADPGSEEEIRAKAQKKGWKG